MPLPFPKRTQPLFLALLVLCCLVGCSLVDSNEKPDEPLFQPGEYGGDPLPDAEELYNVQVSPDGEQIALIRSVTHVISSGSLTEMAPIHGSSASTRRASIGLLREHIWP